MVLVVCVSAALNKETNEEVAIKKISNAFENRIDAKRALREIKILRHMDHPNVIHYHFMLHVTTNNICLIMLFFRVLLCLCMCSAQIISIKDIIRPPRKEVFNDVYIVYELMDTDLHKIIGSDQPLTDDHCQVLPLITPHFLKIFVLTVSIDWCILYEFLFLQLISLPLIELCITQEY